MPTMEHVVALAPRFLEALQGMGHMQTHNLLDLGDMPT
jgi:hypothetical protein